jgi:hypothetical protein
MNTLMITHYQYQGMLQVRETAISLFEMAILPTIKNAFLVINDHLI